MKKEVIDAVDNLAKVFSTLTQDEQIEAVHSLSFLKMIYDLGKDDMIQHIKNDDSFSLCNFVDAEDDRGWRCEISEYKKEFLDYLKEL